MHLMEGWISANKLYYTGDDGDCVDGEQVPVESHIVDDAACAKRPRIDNDNKNICDKKISHPENGSTRKSSKDRGRRIPCPIDPSHLIFESALSKHVLICPAAKQKEEVASQAYFSEGINSGGFGKLGKNVNNSGVNNLQSDMDRAKELVMAVLRVFHYVFISSGSWKNDMPGLSNEQLKSLTERDFYKAIDLLDLSDVEEETIGPNDGSGRLTNTLSKHRVKAGGPRHVQQIASILGHLRSSKLIPTKTTHHSEIGKCKHLDIEHVNQKSLEPETTVIEMGAGRGMLGLVVAGAMAYSCGNTAIQDQQSVSHTEVLVNPSSHELLPTVKLVLVERAGTRAKAETKIRKAIKDAQNDFNHDPTHLSENKLNRDCLALDRVEVTRIKCDLSHVNMPTALPFLAPQQSTSGSNAPPSSEHLKRKTVVVAKHLCGAGTDLALKSLRDLAAAGAIDGCVMATCCHGLCTWNDYVGRDCLISLFCGPVGGLSSFGENDFTMLKRWTSASVLDDHAKNHSHNTEGSNENDDDSSDDGIKEEHTCNISDGRWKGRTIFDIAIELGLSLGGNSVGRACQRIIDHGRCDYIENELFKLADPKFSNSSFTASLKHYVDRNVTPQNALIIASRHQ